MHPHHNQPTAIVIFGGTGDLARTKLLPALYDLFIARALPDTYTILGLSRKPLHDADYQEFVADSIRQSKPLVKITDIQNFCRRFRYISGSFDETETYEQIKTALTDFDRSINLCTNKLFYLAVPPEYYANIFFHLATSDAMRLCDDGVSWSRLLVEKPFGKDLKTAQALERQLCSLFTDEQIYRIDHYLAKDAIENIISLRFANSILTDSWNKERIESIAIKLLETKDVANRGSFYDGIGALRDVGQNHMLQILALLTMPAVDVHDATAVRTARAQTLADLLATRPHTIIRGQYSDYRTTTGVHPASETETYFRIELKSEAKAWQGVAITLEAGKALSRATNEAVITFKAIDTCYCAHDTKPHTHHNTLTISFSPIQRIALAMWVKKPGLTFTLEERELELIHTRSTDTYSPEAYERVLYDCIIGDQTRFVSGTEVEVAWQFITPILEQFATLPLHAYEKGSQGPHRE